MASARRHSIAALEATQKVERAIRDTLRSREARLRRLRRALDRGVALDVAAASVDLKAMRVALDSAVQDLEKARHHLKVAVFAMAHDEGFSISETSRMWGFSRQRGARYAEEARNHRAR